MQIVHFTPDSLDPENARRPGAVAHLPLASGLGELQVSCLYLAPNGRIAVAPTSQEQLLLVVNGKADAWLTLPHHLRIEISAGMGMLLRPEERCELNSETGAIFINVECDSLSADECGISTPERVMRQAWPIFESN